MRLLPDVPWRLGRSSDGAWLKPTRARRATASLHHFHAGRARSPSGLISHDARRCDSDTRTHFSECSLEARHSAWDRDHACAGAQQCDRAASGGARSAERDEREPITPLFAAPPASQAPALLTPREARGCAISALRASSDQFESTQVRGPVSGAPAREAGEAGATPAHLTSFSLVEMKQSNQPSVEGKSVGASPITSAIFRGVA